MAREFSFRIDEHFESHPNTEDSYRCVLCDTGYMRKYYTSSHLSGRYHQKKLNHEESKRRLISIRVECKITRIEQLGHKPWRDNLKAQLLDFVTQRHDRQIGRSAPDDISLLLEKYEKLEKTSLLELAVWKASCLHFDGSMAFSTMQDILDLWTLDEDFDPSKYKNERRFTSSVAVIMRGVVEFLGDENNLMGQFRWP